MDVYSNCLRGILGSKYLVGILSDQQSKVVIVDKGYQGVGGTLPQALAIPIKKGRIAV
jgi:hypothetical protein